MAGSGETIVWLVRWAKPGSRAAGCERRAPLRSSPIAGALERAHPGSRDRMLPGTPPPEMRAYGGRLR